MTSPADRIRAKLEQLCAAHPIESAVHDLHEAIEALLPVVEASARCVCPNDCDDKCPAAPARNALLTAASALGTEDE